MGQTNNPSVVYDAAGFAHITLLSVSVLVMLAMLISLVGRSACSQMQTKPPLLKGNLLLYALVPSSCRCSQNGAVRLCYIMWCMLMFDLLLAAWKVAQGMQREPNSCVSLHLQCSTHASIMLGPLRGHDVQLHCLTNVLHLMEHCDLDRQRIAVQHIWSLTCSAYCFESSQATVVASVQCTLLASITRNM